MRKLTLAAIAVTAAALLASFAPRRSAEGPTLPSIDPTAITLAKPGLAAAPYADAN